MNLNSDNTGPKELGDNSDQKNHFLELVMENMPACIFWKDRDLLYLGCNTGFAQDAGFSSPADLLGKSDFEMAWSNQAVMFRADDKMIIDSGLSKLNYEEKSTAPDGREIWLRTSKLPLRDYQNNIVGMLGFYRDITEEKQEQIRVAQEQILYLETLNKALDAIILVTTKAMELRDPYTTGHESRVALIACAIAKKLGWDDAHISGLHMAAMVHDLGKMAIPSELLTKPAKLSKNEEALMQEHPEHGYQLLKDMPFPWPIADWVRQHHERVDGTGYPQGLKGDEISIEAKVLGVADTIEAMSSHRPYRPALGLYAALAEIKLQAGIKFDGNVVKAALSLLEGKESLDFLST